MILRSENYIGILVFILSSHLIELNALTTKAVCNEGVLKVYADGTQIGTHDSTSSTYGTFTVSDGAEVLGLECESSGDIGAMLAEVGDNYISDTTWHCSNTFQTGWSSADFDSSSWQYATEVPEPTARGDVVADAKWIWTSDYSNGDWRVFCRGKIIDQGGPDNAGRRFVIGYLLNINHPDTSPLMDVELYVGTPVPTDVSVRVKTPQYSGVAVSPETFTISAGNIEKVTIPGELIADVTERSTKAIEITATDEVVVYGVNRQTSSNDAFLALPVDAIGREYYAVTWGYAGSPTSMNKMSNILIVAVYDETTVQLTFPTTAIEFTGIAGVDGVTYGPGETLTVTLNAYDTYSIGELQDLTGTHITSTQDISVFTGNRRINIVGSSRDHLVEQIPPVSTWGKTFIMTPIPGRTSGDEYKIVTSEADTTIMLYGDFDGNGADEEETYTVAVAGDTLDLSARVGLVASVKADKPVLVVQFMQSEASHETMGDPAMQILPPVYLYASDYTFVTPRASETLSEDYTNYLTVVIKDSEKDGLKHSGEYLISDNAITFTPIPGSENYFGELYVTTSKEILYGTHRINHDSTSVSFGGFAYGKKRVETYAMTAGYRLTPIAEGCTPFEGTTWADSLDNDCDGSIDEDDCNQGLGFTYSEFMTHRLICGQGVTHLSGVTVTISSQWDASGSWYHGAENSCIDEVRDGDVSTGAWSAASNDVNQWIQVDFGSGSEHVVIGVVTQGRQDTGHTQWVTSYKLAYSDDCSTWQTITDADGAEVVFTGNTDRDSKVYNMLPEAVSTRCFRLMPVTWTGHISMRWDLLTQTINYAVDNVVDDIWADGVFIGDGAGWSYHYAEFPLDTQVLAMKIRDSGGAAGFLAHIPTYGIVTNGDGAWKCTTVEPSGDDWKLAGFDTSSWQTATAYQNNEDGTPWGAMGFIPGHARWIWTSPFQADIAIYCRIELHRDCARPSPVDGGWSDWSAWGACEECGTTSQQTRTRTCSNPIPLYNGLPCDGDASESQSCTVACDPVHGGFSDWSSWDTCDTVTCTQTRARSCNNPEPLYGGDDCVGDRSESQDCPDCGCNSSPCQNGAACSYDGSAYECTCASGFSGTNCEFTVISQGTPVSSCTGVEDGIYHSTGNCNEYVTCSNGVMTSDTCPAGEYFDDGTNACGVDTTTCEDACNPNPCQNGACSYDGEGFACSCDSGFSGSTCELTVVTVGDQVSDCTNIEDGSYHSTGNCNSYVTCSGGTMTSHTCPANQAWDDNLNQCVTETSSCTDACNPTPCINGMCTHDGEGYTCDCDTGFSGTNCDETPCTAAPCEYGGVCSVDGDSYSCACADGYSGNDCDVTPCSTNPCQHGGACSLDGSSYTCSCAAGYSGTTCEVTPCTNDPCQNGGACALDGATFVCTCTSSYSGATCDTETVCASDPCQNEGSCAVEGDGYTCTCADGYTGTNCENEEEGNQGNAAANTGGNGGSSSDNPLENPGSVSFLAAIAALCILLAMACAGMYIFIKRRKNKKNEEEENEKRDNEAEEGESRRNEVIPTRRPKGRGTLVSTGHN